jgi:hypothetical protein
MEHHKMKITEKDFNIITGEETITEREETAQEQLDREANEAEAAKLQVKAEAKAKAKQEIADRLGLTADELKVLLG